MDKLWNYEYCLCISIGACLHYGYISDALKFTFQPEHHAARIVLIDKISVFLTRVM